MNNTNHHPSEVKPKSKRRRRWFLTLVVLGSLGLSLIAGEVALRIYVAVRGWTPNCYAGHLSLFRPHPVVGAELSPNFRLKSATFQISTNSLGLRGPEIEIAKPKGTVRIAILGGSSVFGYLVNDGEEAARILENTLRDKGHVVEVINAGVPNHNLARSLIRFEEKIARLEPDIVILYAGYNDVPYITSSDASLERWLPQVVSPAWERRLGHSVLYQFLAHRLMGRSLGFTSIAGSSDTMTQVGQALFRSNLAAIAAAVKSTGAQLVVCSQATAAQLNISPELRTQLGATEDEIKFAAQVMGWIRQELRQSTKSSQAVFIDVASEIPPSEEYLGDLIHLTKSGEQQLARVLATHLIPLLKPSR